MLRIVTAEKNTWRIVSQADRKNSKARYTVKIFAVLIILLHNQIDHWLFLFKMTFLHRIVEEVKNEFMFQHSAQS